MKLVNLSHDILAPTFFRLNFIDYIVSWIYDLYFQFASNFFTCFYQLERGDTKESIDRGIARIYARDQHTRDSVRTIVRTNCPDNSLICIVQLSGQKCWTIGQFRKEKN